MSAMSSLYLAIIIAGLAAQNITKKVHTNGVSGGTFFFSAVSVFFAIIFFAVTSNGFEMNFSLIPYSIAFAVSYGAAVVFSVISISSGPLWIASLISSFSLMLPTLYGIFFLGENVTGGMIAGFALLSISLVLVNKKSETKKISVKWIVSTVISFFGNGFCSVVQKMQQVKFDGMYKSEFMIISLAIVLLIFAVTVFAKEREDVKKFAKSTCLWGGICGIMNGVVNLFVMIASGTVASSVLFPVISAGGIVSTCAVSVLIFKEKLSRTEFIGFIAGTVSIIFLNM